MIDGGLLSEAEAREHPDKNVIIRCLGPKPTVEVDIQGPLAVQPGDRFLLCSDGLHGLVEDDVIAALAMMDPPKTAVEKLVALAIDRGGHDNISVQIIHRADAFPATGKFSPESFSQVHVDGQELGPAVAKPLETHPLAMTPVTSNGAWPPRLRPSRSFWLGLAVGVVLTLVAVAVLWLVVLRSHGAGTDKGNAPSVERGEEPQGNQDASPQTPNNSKQRESSDGTKAVSASKPVSGQIEKTTGQERERNTGAVSRPKNDKATE
jgi:hypothetical protein